MKETVILFGASRYGEMVFKKLIKRMECHYFCDNDPRKWDQLFCGLVVLPPERLKSIKHLRVIITSIYSPQIILQLFEMGIKEFEIAVFKGNEEVILEHYDYSDLYDLEIIPSKISLITSNFSGSNTLALYKLMPEHIKNKYDAQLLCEFSKQKDYYADLLMSKMVISNQGPICRRPGQLSGELWHGFPLKRMGYMIKSARTNDTVTSEQWNSLDFVASYSKLYTTLMCACFHMGVNSIYETGLPRNDFLYLSYGRKILRSVLKKDFSEQKLILYAPTFRQSALSYNQTIEKNWGNIFGFHSFNFEKFNGFLENNNLILCIKLHPNEEEYVLRQINFEETSNILIVRENLLIEQQIDLYEVLNAFDLLITDYSSIYFDYLLLDRPIIFVPIDIQEYSSMRGFLLDYDAWSPGPKAYNQYELEYHIDNCLSGKDDFREERSRIKRLVHLYDDGNSAIRVWDRIDSLINNTL